MNISQRSNFYQVQIPLNAPDFRAKLEAVKKIPGRRYVENINAWVIPQANYPSVNSLMTAISNNLKVVKTPPPPPQTFAIDPLPELKIQIPLKKELFPFQGNGVAYNLEHGSSLIGDQQGTGKTIQAIATVVAMDLFPCLVITKKTLLLNWKTEFEAWTDKQVLPLTNSRKTTWPFFFKTRIADVGIVNYDALQPFFVNKIEVPKGEVFRVKHIFFKEEIQMWKSIIIDESHYVKEGATKRTKICLGLTKLLPDKGVFLLTGTPLLNKAMDMYTQLSMMNRQHLVGSYSQFKSMYCGKNNEHRLPQLKAIMHKHCYYRRLKSEVRADLPPKTRQIILCDITNREEYDLAESNFRKYLSEKLKFSQGQIDNKLRGEVLAQINILRQLTAVGKIEAVKEWADGLLEENEKIVLFAHHRKIQDTLLGLFKNSVAILSQEVTPLPIIEQNKHLFQTSKDHNVIVCSNSAASEGHTLNAACNLGVVEEPWTFGKLEQMEDRIHRITNTMPAYISIFLAENTIDRKIHKIVMKKKDLHDAIAGSDEEEETKVIDQLINLFNQQ